MAVVELSEEQSGILSDLVLRSITEWQYADVWPGDEVVQQYVDLYRLLNPSDTWLWLTVDKVKERGANFKAR